MTELEKTVRRWLKLRVEIALLKEKQDALRPAIEKALLNTKDNTKQVGAVILSYKEQVRRSFDEKAARVQYGDELDQFYKQTVYRTLQVK